MFGRLFLFVKTRSIADSDFYRKTVAGLQWSCGESLILFLQPATCNNKEQPVALFQTASPKCTFSANGDPVSFIENKFRTAE